MTEAEQLVERTIKKLQEDSRTYKEIARTAGVDYYWLVKFCKGKKTNPTVKSLSKLERALK